MTDVGEQSYRGLKLSFRRRADQGVSLSGNYTLSHCESDTEVSGSFSQFANGYLNPNNPSFDRGNCTQNRRQIGNLSVGRTDAGVCQRGGPRAGVGLEILGDLQRSFGELDHRDHRS